MSPPDPEATGNYSREETARREPGQPTGTPRGGDAGAVPGRIRAAARPAFSHAGRAGGPALSRVRARLGPALARARSLHPEALRTALAVAAGIAGMMLVAAEFLPLLEVVVGSLATVQETVRGGRNHAYALGVLGTLAIIMAYGAARGSRPPAAALAAIGAGALAIAVGVDLPDTRATGSLPQSIAYEDARAQAAGGFYVEILAGAALVAAGGALLALSARER